MDFTKSKLAIVAMSGGVDSSVAAYLTLKAGYDARGVMLRLYDNPEGSDSALGATRGEQTDDAADARAVADRLGMDFQVLDRRDAFKEKVIEYFISAYERGETPNPCVVCNPQVKFAEMFNAIESAASDGDFCERGSGNLRSAAGDECGPGDSRSAAGGSEDPSDLSGAFAVAENLSGASGSFDSNNASSADASSSVSGGVVVTGHYARIERDPGSGRFLLKKSLSVQKDQSYVLYALSQSQLSRILFPLGDMAKEETRAIAEELGFKNAHKSDSQDICFIPDGDYASFITRTTGHEYPGGDFVDARGNILGRHDGIIKYTIGQRKGLGLAMGRPVFVTKKDAAQNRIVIGDNADLFERELEVHRFNWIACSAPSGSLRADVRIRYNAKESPAEIIPLAEDRVKIIFDEPQRAIAPGQSAVVYDGDIVIGGGVICGTSPIR